jgi:hypothetical protein
VEFPGATTGHPMKYLEFFSNLLTKRAHQSHRHLVGLESLPPQVSFTGRAARRPGERREPLLIEIGPGPFLEAVGAYGLGIPAAIELTFEFELVRRDLAELGKAFAVPALAEDPEEARISSPIAAPMAGYLRTLWNLRPRTIDPLELEAPIDVPLRLFPRVLEIDPREALTPSRLGQALSLERAAVAAGRTMSEYALLIAGGR